MGKARAEYSQDQEQMLLIALIDEEDDSTAVELCVEFEKQQMSDAARNLLKKQMGAVATSFATKEKAKQLKSLAKEKRKLTSQESDLPRKAIRNEIPRVEQVIVTEQANLRDNGAKEEVAPVSSSLPMGFFDDPTQDFAARGLNLREEIEKKESELDNVVGEFLAEVKAEEPRDSSSVDDDGDDEVLHEDEEELIRQHAYMARLASLLYQSEATQGDIITSIAEQSGATSKEIETLLEYTTTGEEAAVDRSALASVDALVRSRYTCVSDVEATSSASESEEENQRWNSRSFL